MMFSLTANRKLITLRVFCHYIFRTPDRWLWHPYLVKRLVVREFHWVASSISWTAVCGEACLLLSALLLPSPQGMIGNLPRLVTLPGFPASGDHQNHQVG